MILSKESQDFLENLRLYLVSSGKNESESEEIISELEDHLYEAEKSGKNVEDIVGRSPKDYMEQVAGEMTFDRKGIMKYGGIIIVLAFSYLLLGDVVRGGIELSLLEALGYPLIFISFTLLTAGLFRHLASSKKNKTKEWTLIGIVGMTPILLFLGLIYLNKVIGTPSVTFSFAANVITVIATITVFVITALWIKSLVTIMIPALLYLPEVLLGFTNYGEETQLLASTIIMFGGLFIYLLLMGRKDVNKTGAL
ncbi:hypothetical protein LF817_18490 [Halobacillus sp. A1]|uniref:HAAS domain-containing protein n=1 Tax=Halobacillus sp. A1 TaxID=2880262 RepID=UPI0020A698B5|nr:hypothetical protein [Halobacillus sp. A1]MCP3033318.1 hypothetical protein [Halobacillus sp. A1]